MPRRQSIFEWYFTANSRGKCIKLFRAIGIVEFGKLVRATAGTLVLGLRPRKELYAYFVVNPHSIESIRRTEWWSRFNELVHLFFTIFCTIFAIKLASRGYTLGCASMIMLGVVNFYLVMLQRFNRAKMYRIMAQLRKRNAMRNAT